MWSLWCPKVTSPSTAAVKMEEESATAATAAASIASSTGSSRCSCCCLVTKLVRKLKRRRHSKRLRSASRQGSFQCRYDPLSYSLNFDDGRGGCGSLLDEDYYKFYAFSSRFVANPQRSSSCPIIPVVAGGSH
ncbi:uncharacterized protein LOC129284844 [Prosopis cineraria]|uniref:uncharacterized protein LOC129284844 n=1 Tax=Prosopis cineraria TaxID=364024 RepID=UPI00240FB33D|nr:uncharacterized protein LOC129284844 [Prosopis cineraria]